MPDYNNYDFTIKEADLLRVLRDAASHGCRPSVVINGMFYDVELDDQDDKIDVLPYEIVDGLPF